MGAESEPKQGGDDMDAQGERLEIGQTIKYGLETIGAKPLPFVLLTLLVGGFNTFFNRSMGESFTSSIALYSISLLSGALLAVVVTYLALKARFGRDATVRPAFVRTAGLYFLVMLGILLGFLLLIVPGIYLAISWLLALPALMAEDLSVTGALSRSMKLSGGHRGTLVGLILLMVVPILLLGGAGMVLAITVFGAEVRSSLAYELAIEIGSTAVGVVSNVIYAEAYITVSGHRNRLTALDEIFA
jgi:hypothetical protein